MSKKLILPSCLFCVNSSTSVRKFKITEDYDGGNTIRYDLTNFLGHQIEPYLKDDDVLCSNCMNFFENMAYTKRRLIDFLRNRDESADIKMQGFNDIWKGFTKFAVTLVKFNPNDAEETWDSDAHTRCQTPTPLIHSYSESYNHKYEQEFMVQEGIRSASAAPSEASSEVCKLLKGKKKGHKWNERKGEQKSRALSKIYDNERNCYSTGFAYRRPSTCRPRSKKKQKFMDRKPLKTRSVSRLEVQLASKAAEEESYKFYCTDLNCTVFFKNLDNLILHKVLEHKITARFDCSQCMKSYTTKEELQIHSSVHDTDIIHCFQCRAELVGTVNLQKHLQQHQEYSIECQFCYLSFLSRAELKEHQTNEHKGKNRTKIHKSTILISIVNEEKVKSTNFSNNNNDDNNYLGKKYYESRVLFNEDPQTPRISEPETPINITKSTPITISDASSSVGITDSPLIAAPSEESACEMELVLAETQTESVPICVSSDNVLTEEPDLEECNIKLIESEENLIPICQSDSHIIETDVQVNSSLRNLIADNLKLTRSRPIVRKFRKIK